MRGGKRAGAGRQPAPPTIMIRVRLTPEQHKAYTERGADIWLKRVISEKAGNYIMDKSCK
jgi:hypothetical protein